MSINRAIKLIAKKFKETESVHDNRNRVYQCKERLIGNISAINNSVPKDSFVIVRSN